MTEEELKQEDFNKEVEKLMQENNTKETMKTSNKPILISVVVIIVAIAVIGSTFAYISSTTTTHNDFNKEIDNSGSNDVYDSSLDDYAFHQELVEEAGEFQSKMDIMETNENFEQWELLEQDWKDMASYVKTCGEKIDTFELSTKWQNVRWTYKTYLLDMDSACTCGSMGAYLMQYHEALKDNPYYDYTEYYNAQQYFRECSHQLDNAEIYYEDCIQQIQDILSQ